MSVNVVVVVVVVVAAAAAAAAAVPLLEVIDCHQAPCRRWEAPGMNWLWHLT